MDLTHLMLDAYTRFCRGFAPVLSWARPDRPIFVVGAPRSGTTLLSGFFLKSSHVFHFGREAWFLWSRVVGRRGRRFLRDGQALDERDANFRERTFVHAATGLPSLGRRFVEKTPANSLRLRFLHAAFDDGYFVVLYRDGRDTVSSLIETWRWEAMPGRALPLSLAIPGFDGPRWKHAVPPGWAPYTRRPLEEVCAFQWASCTEAMLADRAAIPPERLVEVRYERLVRDPVATMREVFRRVDLPFEPAVERACAELRPINYKRPPKPEKWREENPDMIRRILPMIAATQAKLGYPTGFDDGDGPAAGPAAEAAAVAAPTGALA